MSAATRKALLGAVPLAQASMRLCLRLGVAVLAAAWISACGSGARATATHSAKRPTVCASSGCEGKQTLNCFTSPMACGYPDPAAAAGSSAHVGPAQSCSSMTQIIGNVTTSTGDLTIQNETINGMLYINRPNVTVNNVCVITPDADSGPSIYIEAGAYNTLVENTSAGAADRDSPSMQSAVSNWSSEPATLDHDYFHNCGECIHDGDETVSSSYVIANTAAVERVPVLSLAQRPWP